MIDPILSLVFSIYHNPGVYALLLGSGISRAAGIPTGWEITLDLIEKLAKLIGEDCGSDPEAWYKQKYNQEPDYGNILDELAKSPAERNRLLKKYFEPSQEERERGLRVPTVAHKAIAKLVLDGYIKVIITTNFDRLLEKALEEIDIHVTVLSTIDSIEGAFPLIHSNCTIIKVHGDYLDTRIKNTAAELEHYDEKLDQLLSRIFDEFGLIICGWSADWDVALRAALERSGSFRFSIYWTTKGEPGDEAKRLIALKRASIIKIRDADTFFKDLNDKTSALHHIEKAHPLSAKIAVAGLKKYIAEDRFLIEAHDLILTEANRLREEFSGDSFSYQTPFNLEVFKDRVMAYESQVEILQALFIAGCYWGKKPHEYLWGLCLERIVREENSVRRGSEWEQLSFYPALILFYSGGLSSLIAKKYETFSALINLTKHSIDDSEFPLVLELAVPHVIRKETAGIIFDMGRHYTPLSMHLQQILGGPLKEYLLNEKQYVSFFDRFEYLFALAYADLFQKYHERVWGPVGCFLWRNRDETEMHVINIIDREITEHGVNWPPLRAGLFDGSLDRLNFIKEEFKRFFYAISYF
jgi:hypothetical protein